MFMHFGNSQVFGFCHVYRLAQGGQEEEGEGEEEREGVGTDNTATEEGAGEREEEAGEGKREEGGGGKTRSAEETNNTTIHRNCQIYTQKDRKKNIIASIRAQYYDCVMVMVIITL